MGRKVDTTLERPPLVIKVDTTLERPSLHDVTPFKVVYGRNPPLVIKVDTTLESSFHSKTC